MKLYTPKIIYTVQVPKNVKNIKEFYCEMNFCTSFNYLCEKAISIAKYVSNRTCWNEFSRLAEKWQHEKTFRLSFALNFSMLYFAYASNMKKDQKKKFFMTKKPQKWQLKFSSLFMLLLCRCWKGSVKFKQLCHGWAYETFKFKLVPKIFHDKLDAA